MVLDRVQTAIERRLGVTQLEVVMGAASEEPVELVEASRGGIVLGCQTEVPFPEGAADVTARLEELGENPLVQRQAGAALPCRIDPGAVLISPGHEPRARRRANVPTDIPLREEHAFTGQSIHVGRGNLLRMMPVETDVRITLIVADDDDDVRLRSRCQPRPPENRLRPCRRGGSTCTGSRLKKLSACSHL